MYACSPCKFTHNKILKIALYFPTYTGLQGGGRRAEEERAGCSLPQNQDPLNQQTHYRETRLGSQAPFMMGEMTVFTAH